MATARRPGARPGPPAARSRASRWGGGGAAGWVGPLAGGGGAGGGAGPGPGPGARGAARARGGGGPPGPGGGPAPAANAIDGDASTAWCAAGTSGSLVVDL